MVYSVLFLLFSDILLAGHLNVNIFFFFFEKLKKKLRLSDLSWISILCLPVFSKMNQKNLSKNAG